MEYKYLGITGITKQYEMSMIRNYIKKYRLEKVKSHIIMINFLVSYRYFNNDIYPHSKEFINPKDVFNIINNIYLSNIQYALHYNTKTKLFSNEIIDILNIIDNVSNKCLYDVISVIQLNILEPDVNEIKIIKNMFPNIKIVLQVTNKWLIPSEVLITDIKKQYSNVIDYLLLDISRGFGKSIDLYSTNYVNTYKMYYNIFFDKSIGFAGGFNDDNIVVRIKRINNILGSYNFSVDAQGKLRNIYNELDLGIVEKYIQNFAKFFINENI